MRLPTTVIIFLLTFHRDLNLAWGFIQDFTANRFWKDACGCLALPNSCSVATWDEREKRSRDGRDDSGERQRGTETGGEQRWNRADRQRDIKREDSNMRGRPHLLDCVCGQKREEESGRNKTINMNSTLGNVGFLDNRGQSQTNGLFHNNSRQTETLLW